MENRETLDVESIVIKYKDKTEVEIFNRKTIKNIIEIIKLTIRYGLID